MGRRRVELLGRPPLYAYRVEEDSACRRATRSERRWRLSFSRPRDAGSAAVAPHQGKNPRPSGGPPGEALRPGGRRSTCRGRTGATRRGGCRRQPATCRRLPGSGRDRPRRLAGSSRRVLRSRGHGPPVGRDRDRLFQSSARVPADSEGSRNSVGMYLGVRTVVAPVTETATTAVPSLDGPTMTSLSLRRPLVDALPPRTRRERPRPARTTRTAPGSSRAPVANEVLLAGVRVARREPVSRRTAANARRRAESKYAAFVIVTWYQRLPL